MTFAEKIERLARHLPGVAGYQDREASRSTDKVVRQRLSAELDEAMRQIEKVKARCVDGKDISSLNLLARLDAKLDKLSHMVMYAGYGYSGLFDARKIDTEELAQLYAFDLGLFEDIGAVRLKAEGLARAGGEALKEGTVECERLLDAFERTFMSRQEIIEGR